MSYKLFADSIQNFSDLEHFCKVYKYDDESKSVYSYDKTKMDLTHPSQHLYRSIVVHNGEVVSFASPKMTHPEIFSQKYNDENWCDFELSCYFEGTMINVYHDNISNQWKIATKRMLNGMNKPNVNGPTFKEMFDDVCENYCKIDIQELLNNIQNQVLKVSKLHNKDRRLSFSFVMNHSSNPMISAGTTNTLFLLSIFSIGRENDSQVVSVHELDLTEIFDDDYFLNTFKNISTTNNFLLQIPSLVASVKYCPRHTNFKGTLIELMSNHLSLFNFSRNELIGFVIRNKRTNERTKMFTNGYRYFKMIKGNYLRHIDRFVEYSRESAMYNGQGFNTKLDEFLGSFPEYYNICNYYYQGLWLISHNLLKLYQQVNVQHVLKLNQCDRLYKQHIYKLHGIYLNQVKNDTNRPNHLVLNDVYDYLINLPISNIVYLLTQHGYEI